MYFNSFMIRLKLMEGITDPAIKHKVIKFIQKKPDKIYGEDLLVKARQFEVNKKNGQVAGTKSSSGYTEHQRGHPSNTHCNNYGHLVGHLGGNSEASRITHCPAHRKDCDKCKQPNHFAKVTSKRPFMQRRHGSTNEGVLKMAGGKTRGSKRSGEDEATEPEF